ncbi:uncharacterized protein NECHADRAFT_95558 [Fusarium vanettenii 77-13-4]|uniref:NCT transcriptional regulatory complex subunit A n=1 Tax=Fusarium vanettenii (strain ATCC MYA-4622 / CBS 123669 / FGSC 9596 / NRRL 45880 / 77-13-4) TaxID=660122 RepID=C7YYU7_FUSV7|nr:uncharacterized protein NECHADRAFT_95558 [Fusarium vanettenii 77-13-4]EEU43257.1 hypothetical protein NECHADRAFT_95558 [Fusarium vanettenii 77-13-4]
MSADDSSYAPKSPDLSSFYSGGPTQPAPQKLQHPQTGSHLPCPGYEYKAESPAYNRSASFSSYVPPSLPLSNNITIGIDNDQPNNIDHQRQLSSQPRFVGSEYQPYSAQPTFLQDQYPSSYSFAFTEQAPRPGVASYTQAYPPPIGAGSSGPSSFADPSFSTTMPPRRAAPPPAPAIEPSPVKTKFPTARIKRIMQADEEVGKVAQQTPIAVGKALELFMIQLVTKSADIAKEKGGKRVTAPMLKQVVEMDEQWDFLRDIVSRVENEKEGSKAKAKQESSSDEEMPEPKKRRGGRRKKT